MLIKHAVTYKKVFVQSHADMCVRESRHKEKSEAVNFWGEICSGVRIRKRFTMWASLEQLINVVAYTMKYTIENNYTILFLFHFIDLDIFCKENG